MPRQNHDSKRTNKSAAIREAIAENPIAPSKKIVALLGDKGVKVQPSLVYYIKSKQRQMQRRRKRDEVNQTSQKTGCTNPVELVLKVRSLASEAGGIKNLKLLVDVLAVPEDA